jgi:16S rRNA (adenine1518-N6/adenine1519-N6)-dimethyltransferase
MSNVKIVQESILKHDLSIYDKIIGNLPYYITSETIEYCLLNSYRAKSMVFMIQKEVLSRLISQPKQDGYGPLAILVSFLGEAKRIFNVGRSNFVPAPKVDSVVVEINMKQDIDHETARQLHKITNSLFHHRRKTIRNNLTLYLKSSEKADRLIAELGVDGSKRPEELDLSFYLTLIKQLKF